VEYCPDCEKHKKSFLRGIALYEYDSVKDSINYFKNNSRPEYAVFYADGIERYLSDIIKSFHADVLVPIPLHPTKLKKRGYNQSELLANELSKRFDIPVDTHLLERTKKTKEQKKLTGNERLKNTVGAFHMLSNGVKYNNIILVDDVYTTGATLDEASRTLISGGLKNVFFVTVAIGSGS
jgi:ComF family protein